jgi:hypothetical protein
MRERTRVIFGKVAGDTFSAGARRFTCLACRLARASTRGRDESTGAANVASCEASSAVAETAGAEAAAITRGVPNTKH